MSRVRTYLGALMIVLSPAVVLAQGGTQPPAQQQTPQKPPAPQTPQTQQQKRRTIEVRGQAPAPEVVTVRPREIPQFQRKVITPVLYDPPPPAPPIAFYIVLPAPLSTLRATAPPNPPPKPD